MSQIQWLYSDGATLICFYSSVGSNPTIHIPTNVGSNFPYFLYILKLVINMNGTYLKICELINPNLGMNSSAKHLFDFINNSTFTIFTIDFHGVDFMGRSFAQEYLSQKKHTKKIVTEINEPENVWRMFDVVEKDFERIKKE